WSAIARRYEEMMVEKKEHAEKKEHEARERQDDPQRDVPDSVMRVKEKRQTRRRGADLDTDKDEDDEMSRDESADDGPRLHTPDEDEPEHGRGWRKKSARNNDVKPHLGAA
ncbi:MAG: hypothetical protein JO089_02415, partial [Alphaproteobacteria bacterium]|nr:hypothetical protein [Alphaproteobacteria bacterium]